MLKSPKRKIRPCIDCGRDCAGKRRCLKCHAKYQRTIWTLERRREQSGKLLLALMKAKCSPNKTLLASKDSREKYFREKYGV